MQEDTFWQIIGVFSSERGESEYLNEVINKLTLMTEDDIFQFAIILCRKQRKLCNWNCAGVYYLIDSFNDDEHFSDFRLWVIAKGETFYNSFLGNPENVAEEILAACEGDMPYLEGLDRVSGESLFKKKGIIFTSDNMADFHAPLAQCLPNSL